MKRLVGILLFSCLLMAGAPKRVVLAVWSHPDDETVIGPLVAHLAREGHDVWQVFLTSGQKGFSPNTAIKDGEELGRTREGEVRCSARALGVHEPILLGYQDQGISSPKIMVEIVEKLRRLIEEKKPDVIFTWGPDGVTGHPDHRTTSNLASEVFQSPALLKHRPRKLYYVAFPDSLGEAIRKSFGAPLRTVADDLITTEVICEEADLVAAFRSIQCHKTQWSAEVMKSRDVMMRGIFNRRVYLRQAFPAARSAAKPRERGVMDGLGGAL
jgi:LmbE family N-acetylglucosaminyl deacetylase